MLDNLFLTHESNHKLWLWVLCFSLNLKSERTKVPNDSNDEDKRLDMIGEVYKLKIDDVNVMDLDRYDS